MAPPRPLSAPAGIGGGGGANAGTNAVAERWRPEVIIDGALLPVWREAETGLARLDQALLGSDSALRAAWLEATRLDEVVRSSRCDGRATTLERVAVLEADSALGLIEADDRFALSLLTAHRSLDRADSAELVTPLGLATLYARGFHDPGERPEPYVAPAAAALDVWLSSVAPLVAAAGTRALSGLLGPVALLGEWLRAAPFETDSAGFARLLVPVLAWRFGLTTGAVLTLGDRLDTGDSGGGVGPPVCGAALRGPAARPRRWLGSVLSAVAVAAGDGQRRLATLSLRRQRWLGRLGRRRRHSRMAAAAGLALATPLLSGRLLIERLGLSPRGATLIIAELVALGILREVSGRSRFRLYTAIG